MSYDDTNSKQKAPAGYTWLGIFLLTGMAAVLYGLMEWLFIVTKPSFLNALSLQGQVEVLLFSVSLILVVACLSVLPLVLIGLVPRLRRLSQQTALLAPAALLAVLVLLMVDNFTYTVFRFGIVSSEGIFRGLYAAAFLLVWFLLWLNVQRYAQKRARRARRERWQRPVLYGTIVGAFLVLGAAVLRGDIGLRTSPRMVDARLQNRPNVLLITTDSLNAAHMSAYGYARDTTPRMRALAEESLVAENAFPNGGNTTASLVSMYTGKYPSETRVMYPPNILRDAAAYQHLPGILRQYGYYSVQISTAHYADAFTLNVLNGFDVANGRTLNNAIQARISRYFREDFAYYIYEVANRLVDRFRHIFYLKKMTNAFEMVLEPVGSSNDLKKMETLLEVIRSTEKPLFVHMHLLATHGPKYNPQVKVFSKDKPNDKQEAWDEDFYDDTILYFDGLVGKIVDTLKEENKLENSLLILGSDHDQRFLTGRRLPLMIRFPNSEHGGRITTNVQNLDIAPTVLDYLKIPIPGYMKGQSLLRLSETQRPVFAFRSYGGGTSNGLVVIDPEKIKPPFYQFGSISMVYCHQFFSFSLYTEDWSSSEVEDYGAPCQDTELLSDQDAYKLILDHLQETGFDTSTLTPQITASQ